MAIFIVDYHNNHIHVHQRLKRYYQAFHFDLLSILTYLCLSSSLFRFSLLFSSLQVWDLENMLPIQALKRHEKAVQSMTVWYDAVFTGSEDEEIKVK